MVEAIFMPSAKSTTSLPRISKDLRPSISGSVRSWIREEVVYKRTILLPPVLVMNVPFQIRREGDFYFFESKVSPSLSVSGRGYTETYSETVKLLHSVITEYVFVDEDSLTEDAKELRRYIIDRVFSVPE